jgi:hypothetical protein
VPSAAARDWCVASSATKHWTAPCKAKNQTSYFLVGFLLPQLWLAHRLPYLSLSLSITSITSSTSIPSHPPLVCAAPSAAAVCSRHCDADGELRGTRVLISVLPWLKEIGRELFLSGRLHDASSLRFAAHALPWRGHQPPPHRLSASSASCQVRAGLLSRYQTAG